MIERIGQGIALQPHPDRKTEATPAAEIQGLVKEYNGRRAVDGLTFEVQRGEIFALLGPNGAGKTTTVEILEGFRKPDGGSVRVLGLDPIGQAERLKPQIGVMLQQGGLYQAITPREALELFAHFYDRPADTDELIELVGLQDAQTVRYRRLSGGQKQRLALALALLPNPEMVFLDEPTAGMDPQGRRLTWEIITRLKEKAVTVVLTTHYLEEAERLADRVAIIDQGRLVALDTPDRLIRRDSSVVRLRVATPLPLEALTSLPSAQNASQGADDGVYVLETADAASLAMEITGLLRDRDVALLELRVGHGTLEDVYLQLTGKEPEE